jgi:hypothetical protein
VLRIFPRSFRIARLTGRHKILKAVRAAVLALDKVVESGDEAPCRHTIGPNEVDPLAPVCRDFKCLLDELLVADWLTAPVAESEHAAHDLLEPPLLDVSIRHITPA